jgi:hypothetical protein
MGTTAATEKATGNSFESTLGAIASHPTRVLAYVILNERVSSPSEIAKLIGKEVGHVGYHCSKLLTMGVIELVDEVPVRGAVEHFYSAVKRPIVGDTDWAKLSPDQRDHITRLTMQLIVANAAQAVNEGTFDGRMNRCLVRQTMQVDEMGFAELHDLDEQRYLETLEVEARSAERQAEDPDTKMISTESFAGFYERAPKASRAF